MSIEHLAVYTIADQEIYHYPIRRNFSIPRTNLFPSKISKRLAYIPGFLNHRGEFLNEEQALIEARGCGQIKNIYFNKKDKLLTSYLK